MNKIIAIVFSVGLMFATGCITYPDVEKSSAMGSAVGITTAFVLNNQVEVPNDVRNSMIRVMAEVDRAIPSTNETFNTTWTPIAKSFLDNLTDAEGNHLSDNTKTCALSNFSKIASLLDWYVEKKGMKQYQECVDAFVHAFTEAFTTKFKPVNNLLSSSATKDELDEDVMSYFNYD